jgi:predicted amidohydrolase YtcJ
MRLPAVTRTLALALTLPAAGCVRNILPVPYAELVVLGPVWTGVPGAADAGGVAVWGEHIAAVGSVEEMRGWIGPRTRVVDAYGGMVVPGFIDSHVHFVDGGFRLASVQLRDARTPAQFAARIRDFARTLPAGTWITGGDWDH